MEEKDKKLDELDVYNDERLVSKYDKEKQKSDYQDILSTEDCVLDALEKINKGV